MKNFGNCQMPKCLAVVLSFFIFCFPPGVFGQEEAGLDDLDVSLGDLLNLEVSVATKTAMTLDEAPSIVSVITAAEIRNMGARNLVDVLRTTPGFDFTHCLNIPLDKIDIRGMSSWANDKVKLLVNGHVKTFDNYTLDLFPVEIIERIEIIRGPGSALYGSNAFLGVINIITKDGGEGETSGVGFKVESYDTAKAFGDFSHNKDKLKAYFYTDWRTTGGYEGEIEQDQATNHPFLRSSVPGEMTNECEHYTLFANIDYDGLYFSGFFQKSKRNAPIGVAKVLVDEDDISNQYYFGELGYKHSLSDKGGISFRAYYDNGEYDNVWELFPEETGEILGFPPGEGLYGRPTGKASVTGGEIVSDYEVYSGIQIVGGVSYEYRRYYDLVHLANHNVTGAPLVVDGVEYAPLQYLGGWTDISENGNFSETGGNKNLAFYGQCIVDLKHLFSLSKGVENLTFTLGGRYDDYDDIGSTANPRFGLVYSPTASLYFKALYGTAFRAPSHAEMYVQNNPATFGNKDLNPEEIETMEFQIGYNFSEKAKTSLSFFNNKSEDLIQKLDLKWQNIGEMEANGIEAEFKYQTDARKYAYCNLTWQQVENTTNMTIVSEGGRAFTQGDFEVGSIPEIYGNIGVNYDFLKYAMANVSLTYIGERDRSEQLTWSGEDLVRADRRDPVDDVVLANASLTFMNFLEGMEVQLSCFNIFDADHRSPDPDGYIYYDMPMSGRWFAGQVSYSF